MNTEWLSSPSAAWLMSTEGIQVAASLASIFIYFLVTRLAFPKIEKGVEEGKFKSDATLKAFRVVRLISGTVLVVALFIIWGFDFSGLLVIATSVITVVGIALFASWSILSNVTAFILLLVHSSYRRGNYIRVIDVDNYIEGYIAEVNLINTRLITEDREVVIYPNNLLITRPTIINPRTRLGGVGKITDLAYRPDSQQPPVDQNE